MQVFWFIPTTGDRRYLGDSRCARETNFPYLRQIASAVDEPGCEGVMLPTGNLCKDAWVSGSSVMPFLRQLKFLVAIRLTIMSTTLADRMAAKLLTKFWPPTVSTARPLDEKGALALPSAKFAGLAEGDAHVIRNAGGRASDDAIRSLVISYRQLARYGDEKAV